ncbi:MAG: hypothetical protein WA299_10185, partial [Candidatus Acidiferrum sp.]
MPLAILLLVLLGLLVVITPFLTIALFVREARLRKELHELAEENAKQHTKLQRAIGELQSKTAATASSSAPAGEKPLTPEVRQPVPAPGSFPHVQIPAPVVVPLRAEVQPPIAGPIKPSIPVTEKKYEPAAEQEPQVPALIAPLPPAKVTPPVIPTATPLHRPSA